MPPHCDSKDGPVVQAAMRALDAGDVNLVLPYVYKKGEKEIKTAFRKVMAARRTGETAREVADLYFFETVVRVHREGEGAPYTGLKPAGLDVGPVIPLAEAALETGKPDRVVKMLTDIVRDELAGRFEHAMHLKKHASAGVTEARQYVEAMLGFQVYSHKLYLQAKADPHEGGDHHHG